MTFRCASSKRSNTKFKLPRRWRKKQTVSNIQFEEEEFSTDFNGKIILRILSQVQPYWKWVLGFIVTVGMVSSLDSIFTYLGKLIVDEGIVPGNRDALIHFMVIYGGLIFV